MNKKTGNHSNAIAVFHFSEVCQAPLLRLQKHSPQTYKWIIRPWKKLILIFGSAMIERTLKGQVHG